VAATPPAKGANLFRALFQKKSVTTRGVTASAPALRNSPERHTVTPTPILIPRPMASNEGRHLPLAKRLSNKLKEPFANSKNC
jgi:hypothetical protein